MPENIPTHETTHFHELSGLIWIDLSTPARSVSIPLLLA